MQDFSKRTIEDLENIRWGEPSHFQTNLVKEVFLLRKKKLGELSSSDLTTLITQKIGLKFLIPIAIRHIQKNILEETKYFPGDLLYAILEIDNKFWTDFKEERMKIVVILNKEKANINTSQIINEEIKEDLNASVKHFLLLAQKLQ